MLASRILDKLSYICLRKNVIQVLVGMGSVALSCRSMYIFGRLEFTLVHICVACVPESLYNCQFVELYGSYRVSTSCRVC